jgi:hypothetical protein
MCLELWSIHTEWFGPTDTPDPCPAQPCQGPDQATCMKPSLDDPPGLSLKEFIAESSPKCA